MGGWLPRGLLTDRETIFCGYGSAIHGQRANWKVFVRPLRDRENLVSVRTSSVRIRSTNRPTGEKGPVPIFGFRGPTLDAYVFHR